MWLYTCYMLFVYLTKRGLSSDRIRVSFSEFADFVFGRVWGCEGLVFHDSEEDLERDLRYLDKLGVLKYHDHEKVIELDPHGLKLLEQIARDLENDPLNEKIPSLRENLTKIRRAVEDSTTPYRNSLRRYPGTSGR